LKDEPRSHNEDFRHGVHRGRTDNPVSVVRPHSHSGNTVKQSDPSGPTVRFASRRRKGSAAPRRIRRALDGSGPFSRNPSLLEGKEGWETCDHGTSTYRHLVPRPGTRFYATYSQHGRRGWMPRISPASAQGRTIFLDIHFYRTGRASTLERL
jgi:hypothetical protein